MKKRIILLSATVLATGLFLNKPYVTQSAPLQDPVNEEQVTEDLSVVEELEVAPAGEEIKDTESDTSSEPTDEIKEENLDEETKEIIDEDSEVNDNHEPIENTVVEKEKPVDEDNKEITNRENQETEGVEDDEDTEITELNESDEPAQANEDEEDVELTEQNETVESDAVAKEGKVTENDEATDEEVEEDLVDHLTECETNEKMNPEVSEPEECTTEQNGKFEQIEGDELAEDSSEEEMLHMATTFGLESVEYESLYQDGDRGQHVKEMKKDLVNLGFVRWSDPTAAYGSNTARVVREFQDYYDLQVTGVADEATRDKIAEILNPPYQNGDRGRPVVELKESLVTLGFANWSNPTQFYGNITTGVVEDFQRVFNLTVNGIAGKSTLDRMQEALAGDLPYVNGDRGQHVKEMKQGLVDLGFVRWSDPTAAYGSNTARVVKEFQDYYGLLATGIADETTRNKITEVLNPPYQKGDRGKPVVELKENLVTLGFANWSNPTQFYGNITAGVIKDFQHVFNLTVNGMAGKLTLDKMQKALAGELPYVNGDRGQHVKEMKQGLVDLGFVRWSDPTAAYGSNTARVVKEFQDYYGLLATGIADEDTRMKIAEILKPPYQKGDRGKPVVELKEKLVDLGFAKWSSPTQFYGDITATVVKDFQNSFGLSSNGVADQKTIETLAMALKDVINYTEYDLPLAKALSMQLSANPQTDKKYAYVSKNYINGNSEVTASTLNIRNGPCACDDVIGSLTKGEQVKILSEYNGWYQIKADIGGWKSAVPNEVLYYLDPTNFVNDTKQSFQFLDLSKPSNTSSPVLNNYLKEKGTLEGQGQAFIDASRKNGVNDIYLISHAILETGHGSSKLAQGVKVNGKTVYNMFGIGAIDNCPIECGSQRAYDEGWFTPYDAIVGGAQFIGNGYIKSGQNTLYKMRWNPDSMENLGYASHQYATDIGWAAKQVNSMYDMYQDLGIYHYVLDIPQYKF